MKAVILNCTLKKSPEVSNTEVLAKILADELENRDVRVEIIRTADQNIIPSPESSAGQGDAWPKIRHKILGAEILVIGSPTWVGRMSSEAMKVIERLNGLFNEKDGQGRPPAYNHVAGFVATGNSDGAKHVIGEMIAACSEIGFTVPGQSWAYFNNGSAAGPVLTEAEPTDIERSRWMCAVAASNLVAAAGALKSKPIPVPPEQ